MFIWDFVANPVMESILDWFYSQMVGFLGAFFAQMGNMGVELFDLSWVRSVVRFFSQLGWALFAVSVVVSAFECGIEYASGRGKLQQPALNALKGFFAVSLVTTPSPSPSRVPSPWKSQGRERASGSWAMKSSQALRGLA